MYVTLTDVEFLNECDEDDIPTGAVEVKGSDLHTNETVSFWIVDAPSWLVAKAEEEYRLKELKG